MSEPDLNLLFTLDAVLSEGSVVGAAKRLRLSPSAMSRSLARLRKTTGDPLLVRAGRGLVPTPRAIELRERVAQIVQGAQEVLLPAEVPDLSAVARIFTLRTSQGFVENFGSQLIDAVAREAPGVTLRFIEKETKESTSLRDGTVDLETGVIGRSSGPEIRAQKLFGDRFVGVVRSGHPLSKGKVNLKRFTVARHIGISRRGSVRGPVDEALEEIGAERKVAVVVSGFATAIALARNTDLVAVVPERQTENLRTGMRSFELPVDVNQITVSLLWHPRMDADPVHRWLRGVLLEICRA